MTDVLARPYVKKLVRKLRHLETKTERSRRLREDGRCIVCGKVRDGKRGLRCDGCADLAVALATTHKARRAERGLCIDCGGRKEGKTLRCDSCRLKSQGRRKNR